MLLVECPMSLIWMKYFCWRINFFVLVLGGKVLASFEAPSRQFLFPAPSFTPKDDVNQELLLARTPYFSAEKVGSLTSMTISLSSSSLIYYTPAYNPFLFLLEYSRKA